MIFSVNFLSFCVNICFGCHKEHTHPEGSLSTHNIYFGLRYKKMNLYLTSYLEPCMNAWAEHYILLKKGPICTETALILKICS